VSFRSKQCAVAVLASLNAETFTAGAISEGSVILFVLAIWDSTNSHEY